MTRRLLEDRVFRTNSNNGVVAITAEDVAESINRANMISWQLTKDQTLVCADRGVVSNGLAHLLTGPIFCFVSPERYERAPWFMGELSALEVLSNYIVEQGGSIEHGGYWVPFSNGYEQHGGLEQTLELQKIPTPLQFRETFGIGINQIREMATEKANKAKQKKEFEDLQKRLFERRQ